jgi:hypothetical protein
MRNWFASVDEASLRSDFIYERSTDGWALRMRSVFSELFRVVKPGGRLVMEVGEVKKSSIRLDETLLPLGADAGFSPEGILVHAQAFTKTSHIWGVRNGGAGTNTHRMAVFLKPALKL